MLSRCRSTVFSLIRSSPTHASERVVGHRLARARPQKANPDESLDRSGAEKRLAAHGRPHAATRSRSATDLRTRPEAPACGRSENSRSFAHREHQHPHLRLAACYAPRGLMPVSGGIVTWRIASSTLLGDRASRPRCRRPSPPPLEVLARRHEPTSALSARLRARPRARFWSLAASSPCCRGGSRRRTVQAKWAPSRSRAPGRSPAPRGRARGHYPRIRARESGRWPIEWAGDCPAPSQRGVRCSPQRAWSVLIDQSARRGEPGGWPSSIESRRGAVGRLGVQQPAAPAAARARHPARTVRARSRPTGARRRRAPQAWRASAPAQPEHRRQSRGPNGRRAPTGV
jgi:hypothetical protein